MTLVLLMKAIYDIHHWDLWINILSRIPRLCGNVTNNTTMIRIGCRIYSLWRFIAVTGYNYNEHLALVAPWIPLTELYCAVLLRGLSTSDSGDSLIKTHWHTGVDWLTLNPKTDWLRFQRLTNSLLCIAFPLQHRAVPMEIFDHGC
jgi:hypothetical protein